MTQKLHTDREYEAELGRVRDNLLRMTGRVEQMIADSVRAVLEGDLELAKRTIDEDHKVNRIAVNTAERCTAMGGERPTAFTQRLSALAGLNQNQLHEATEAFVARDPARAEKLHDRDDEVDQLYSDIVREVQRSIQGEMASLERGVHVLAVAKFLERIGDHITNLAEHVIFLVRGTDVRHLGKLEN